MPLTANLVAYWKLDETSAGTSPVTRVDIHGGFNATDVNSAASGAGKINNGALLVPPDYLSVAHNAALGPLLLSVQAWIKTGVTDKWILSKEAGTTGYRLLMGGSGGLQWQVHNGSSGFQSAGNATNIADGLWHHCVGTYDGTQSRLYRNGVLQGTAVTTTYSPPAAAGTLLLGTRPGIFDNWSGTLDEIGIWSRALSEAEITELYNAGAGLAYSSFGSAAAKKKKLAHYRSRSVAL